MAEENTTFYRSLASKGFGQVEVARAALTQGLERKAVILLIHQVFTVPLVVAREVVGQAQQEAGNTSEHYLPYWEVVHFGSTGRPRVKRRETDEETLN